MSRRLRLMAAAGTVFVAATVLGVVTSSASESPPAVVSPPALPATAVAANEVKKFRIAEGRDIQVPSRIQNTPNVTEVITATFTLRGWERRRVTDQLTLSLSSREGAQTNNTILCSYHLPDGTWKEVVRSSSGINHPGSAGPNPTLNEELLLIAQTPDGDLADGAALVPMPGEYRCQIITYVEDGGRKGYSGSAIYRSTFLQISAADEEGAESWFHPYCNSAGDRPTCVYLDDPETPKTSVFDAEVDAGTEHRTPIVWTAGPFATDVEVVGTLQMTTCKRGTGSCRSEHEGNGDFGEIRTELAVNQLYSDGRVCRRNVSTIPNLNQTIRIWNDAHHYPVTYRLNAPVSADCGGSRTFALAVTTTHVTNTLPVKIDGGDMVATNRITGRAGIARWADSICVDDQICTMADVNADGRSDAVAFAPSANQVWVALATTGFGFGAPRLWKDSFCLPGQTCVMGDVNGDGMTDAVAFVPSVGHAWVALSTGDGFAYQQQWSTSFCSGAQTCTTADVNGDGRSDAIAFVKSTHSSPAGEGDVFVALSTGSGFGQPRKWSEWMCAYSETCGMGDVNGDGKADAISFIKSTNAAGIGDVWVALSSGNAFGQPAKWSDSFCIDDQGCALADVNGDGKSDAVAFVRSVGQVFVALSTGNGFGTPRPWAKSFCVAGQDCAMGDVNGSGEADAIAFVKSTVRDRAQGDVYVHTALAP